MKIGLIGGTFDPIHYGHLIIGEFARTELNLDKIIYMASGDPIHKRDKKIESGEMRYKLIDLAIEGNKYFENSRLEIDRPGITRTIDTLKELREIYREEEIYFIMGEDSLFNIESWVNFEEFPKLCKFIAFSRGKKSKKELSEHILYLKEKYNMEIELLDAPIIQISSTKIRNRIKNKESIKYLVPLNVESYIYDKGLYGADFND